MAWWFFQFFGALYCSAYVAELWGILEGLKMALSYGFKKVELNVDSKVVVSSLVGNRTVNVNGFRLVQKSPSIVVKHHSRNQRCLIVSIVDPQPGETIVDCCDALGGKTLYMSCHLSGQGMVFAGAVNSGRLRIHKETTKLHQVDGVITKSMSIFVH